MNSRQVLRPRKLTMLVGVLLLLSLSIGIGVVGAQDGDQAQLRVVHAAPDAGDVDVYVDGELALEGLAYTDATDFEAFDEGDYEIAVTAAGGDVSEAVFETSLSLGSGDMITVVAHGSGEEVNAFTVEHDWDDPADDQARIVLVNATSDEADVELQYGEGETFGDGMLSFGNTSNQEVDAGDYDFQVMINDETATTIDGFTVEAGNTYSIFVMGTEGSYEALTYEDMGAAQAPGTDTTPATDATPDADTTPDADATPDADTTPDADATPDADTTPDTDATPDADTTPGADMTPDTEMTPETDTTPDTATTPETASTPTEEAGTGGGDPNLPQTGAGGTAGDSATGWIALAVAGLAVALGGGLIWRTRNERSAA